MAATACARRTLASSISSSSRSLFRSLSSISSPTASSLARSSRHSIRISRIPVELGCIQSLVPLHTATASALLTSMLSVKPGSWGWVSEGVVLAGWG